MVSTIEQRFNAAVNVIRGLPKHGSYQPSNDMLLRFYAYFKQATIGPCKQQRPAFWNVVDKAKWDAYHALGNMPSERAMELYVDELKKIIETMSYTDNVAEFMGSVGELGDVDLLDLEAVAPEAIKQVRSRPNSPFASRESSPVRIADIATAATAAGATTTTMTTTTSSQIEQMLLSNGYHSDEYGTNGHNSAAEYSDDEYIDTVEDDTILNNEPLHQRFSRSTSRRMDNFRIDIDDAHNVFNGTHLNGTVLNGNGIHANGIISATAATTPTPTHATNNHNNTNNNTTTTTTMHVVSANVEPALHQMLRCVEAMRVDLQQINNRINIVERSLADVRQQQLQLHHRNGNNGKQQANDQSTATAKTTASGGVGGVGVVGGGGSGWGLWGRSGAPAPAWWPFKGISPAWFVVLAIVWPLVARRMVRLLVQSRSVVGRRR